VTPNSGSTTYLTPQEFLTRRDARSVYQYATDSDGDPLLGGNSASTAAMIAALVNPATPQGAILAALLMDASGMLESACLRSGRYSPADLAALTGNSAGYMKRILSSMVMYGLMTRRPGPTPPDTIVQDYTDAVKALSDLSEGTKIFAFAEAEAAGLPATRRYTIRDQISNDMISALYYPMFGTRAIARRGNFGGIGRWY